MKEALDVYRKMMLVRLSEEKIREEYFKDEIKTPVHLGVGGEAIAIGVLQCLPRGVKTFGTYRNHAIYLSLSENTDEFFGELYGKVTGASKGKAGSMHLMAPEQGLVATSAVVGTTVPVAVGAAFANSYRNNEDLTVVFFGDGAVEEGAFWESVNFACLHKLRVLFICEDNDLAIHTSKRDRRGYDSLLKTISTFNCHTAEGDGMDVADVMKTTRGLLEKMAEDPKPAFAYFPYFRFYEHVGPNEDFNAGYRKKPSPEEAAKLDPVLCFENYLKSQGYSIQELDMVRQALKKQVNESVEKAQKAPFPASQELSADVYL